MASFLVIKELGFRLHHGAAIAVALPVSNHILINENGRGPFLHLSISGTHLHIYKMGQATIRL